MEDSQSIPVELKSISEGYDLKEVITIFKSIPLKDDGSLTYLEEASRCILETSNLVDDTFPELSNTQKLVKKYRLMSKLLLLKAAQLDKT
jgi:hypothetical protein